MTPGLAITLIIIAVAVFVLGGAAGWIWHHRRGSERGEELSRRVNVALSAFFVMVALMVVFDVVSLTVKFNRYVNETIPRDTAQEQCNTETIAVLQAWVQARVNRDGAMNARDDATIAVLTRIIDGGRASPDEVTAWRDAVANDLRVRSAVTSQLHPLPDCGMKGR